MFAHGHLISESDLLVISAISKLPSNTSFRNVFDIESGRIDLSIFARFIYLSN